MNKLCVSRPSSVGKYNEQYKTEQKTFDQITFINKASEKRIIPRIVKERKLEDLFFQN